MSSTTANIDIASAGDQSRCSVLYVKRLTHGDGAMSLEVSGIAVVNGAASVALSAYKGRQRLSRAREVIKAGSGRDALSLQIEIPSTADAVEIAILSRGASRVTIESVRLRALERLRIPGVTPLALYEEAATLITTAAYRRERVMDSFVAAQRPKPNSRLLDAHAAIRQLLRALDDRHSVLVEPAKEVDLTWRLEGRPTLIRWKMLKPAVGYIAVPTFMANDEATEKAFSEKIISALEVGSAKGAAGWVVDLRENGGGNMWPMLAGLEPLLRGQNPGAFTTPTGSLRPWRIDRVRDHDALDSLSRAPVAVLTSGQTASSGEAVAIAFKGRHATRSFGRPTAGLSTNNSSYRLADGSWLHLTTGVFVDRLGRQYGGPVLPDEKTSWLYHGAEVEQLAASWVADQLAETPDSVPDS